MMGEEQRIFYTEAPTQMGGAQKLILVEQAENRCGITSCPEGGVFHKWYAERIDELHAYMEEKGIDPTVVSEEPLRSQVSALVENISQSEDETIIPTDLVRPVLDFLGIPQ